ncbi:uncharacterized protein LOC119558390 [Drosophila subpulchrella]|uniref:uncharacterized protein LOC119558390 n=1 Tax=Drosophila subpulchrella TaxID=1486046 RepID=UPI0018A18E02|nr:uncharacterized protein LOC119558390 [Drosophila subpulchrella]
MRRAILWLSSGCLLLATLVGAQQIGQDLLISRMGSWQDELNTRDLARATSYLTRKYIADRINTLVVRQDCLECPYEMSHRQRQLVDQILESLPPDLSVLLHSDTPQETSWEYTLFVVKDHTAFKDKVFYFPYELLEREFFCMVVVTEFQSPGTVKRTVGRIVAANLLLSFVNVVVVAQMENGTVAIYSYKLFKANCTPGITVRQINHFDRTTGKPLQTMTDLYPVRHGHLGDCPLNVGANHLPPHLIYKRHRHPPPSNETIPAQDVSGIDWDLLQLLAKALRFRIQLYMSHEPSQIFGEGNVSGCFAQLADESVAIAIGGLSGSDKRRWQFSRSTVYHQSHFVMVVRRDRYLGRFGPLILPFRGKVWGVIIVLLLLAILGTCGLRSRLGVRRPLENLLLVCVGNPVPMHRVPGTGFLRYLLASWLLLTLVLRCAYQARLFDVLRLSHHRPLPEDLIGLIEDNYTLVSNGYHDFYPRQLTRRLGESFASRFERVQRAAPGERLTTISLISNLAYWNHQNRNISKLTFVRQPIYLYQLVIYYPRNSFLRPAVDRKIKQLLSAGVMAHIERRYLQYVDKPDVAANDPDLLPQITHKIMAGAYRIHALVMVLATGMFLLELISGRWEGGLRSWMEWVHKPDDKSSK